MDSLLFPALFIGFWFGCNSGIIVFIPALFIGFWFGCNSGIIVFIPVVSVSSPVLVSICLVCIGLFFYGPTFVVIRTG